MNIIPNPTSIQPPLPTNRVVLVNSKEKNLRGFMYLSIAK